MEVDELRQIGESTQQENETLKNILKESENNTEANQKLLEAESKQWLIIFKIMWAFYRDSIIFLLLQNSSQSGQYDKAAIDGE